jgi:hypothetical protein
MATVTDRVGLISAPPVASDRDTSIVSWGSLLASFTRPMFTVLGVVSPSRHVSRTGAANR